jgi:hypothetical protein
LRGDGITKIIPAPSLYGRFGNGLIAFHQLFGHGEFLLLLNDNYFRDFRYSNDRIRTNQTAHGAMYAIFRMGLVGWIIALGIEFNAHGQNLFGTYAYTQTASFAPFYVDVMLIAHRPTLLSFSGLGYNCEQCPTDREP